MKKRIFVCLTAGVLALAAAVPVFADRVPYVSLGADLNAGEKAEVLKLLGVTEEELSSYTVAQITNEQEHEYLDSYLDANLIGSRALSSVLVKGSKAGSGIQVTTHNITYCTPGMYENALATAGVKDASITVAGPFEISGTAALVGAITSYENMTGETVKKENAETAAEELVTTGQVAESIGSQEDAENLVGVIKSNVVEQEGATREEIEEIIDKAAKEMEINLSQEDRQSIADLMEKIDGLELDIDSLKEQAKKLYDKIEDLGIQLNIDQEQVKGFFQKIVEFFQNLFS